LLVLSLLVSVLGLVLSTREAKRAWYELRHVSPSPSTSSTTPEVRVRPSLASTPDFTQDLPATAPTDTQIRFTAKLARELHLDLQRMQSEPSNADARHLGRTRVPLQSRGDYRDEKALLAGLLGKP
jgi:hypothetical protein